MVNPQWTEGIESRFVCGGCHDNSQSLNSRQQMVGRQKSNQEEGEGVKKRRKRENKQKQQQLDFFTEMRADHPWGAGDYASLRGNFSSE